MEQEAAQELINSKSHEALLVAMRGIAPAEGDVALGESDEPGVGDGDAMGIGAEITQHMFRSAEGLLGLDDPVVTVEHAQPGSEGAWLGKRQKFAVKLKLATVESVAKSSDKLAAEDAAERRSRTADPSAQPHAPPSAEFWNGQTRHNPRQRTWVGESRSYQEKTRRCSRRKARFIRPVWVATMRSSAVRLFCCRLYWACRLVRSEVNELLFSP
jgi:hypothetical protein